MKVIVLCQSWAVNHSAFQLLKMKGFSVLYSNRVEEAWLLLKMFGSQVSFCIVDNSIEDSVDFVEEIAKSDRKIPTIKTVESDLLRDVISHLPEQEIDSIDLSSSDTEIMRVYLSLREKDVVALKRELEEERSKRRELELKLETTSELFLLSDTQVIPK